MTKKLRPRELGIEIGVLKTGTHNAITDVPDFDTSKYKKPL